MVLNILILGTYGVDELSIDSYLIELLNGVVFVGFVSVFLKKYREVFFLHPGMRKPSFFVGGGCHHYIIHSCVQFYNF